MLYYLSANSPYRMSKPQNRSKIYSYIPYDDDESFDKVESSNSQPRTISGTVLPLKESSQMDSMCQGQVRIRNNDEAQEMRSLFPLDQPGIWTVKCGACEHRLNQIGECLDVDLKNNQIRRIIPLQTSQPHSLMKYAIEYQSGRYEKFTSKSLQKWYLAQMVHFLQLEVFGNN